MKPSIRTTAAADGFRGYFYESRESSDKCMVVIIGDDGDDLLDRAVARWLTEQAGCHALCVALRQEKRGETGVDRWPLEIAGKAVRWAQERYGRVGLLGMSMQAALVLSASARVPVSLTAALTPCDFVPWGFHQGKLGRDSHAEWPSGHSAFTWQGEELPFQSAMLEKDAYWQLFSQAKKEYGEMHSRAVFDYSEAHHPIGEECFIPVENIRGRIVLIGAEDDAMWQTARYIRRMEARLREKNFPYPVDVLVYPFGTHFLVPDTLLRRAVPLVGGQIPRMFVSGRKNAAQCRQARQEVERRLLEILKIW